MTNVMTENHIKITNQLERDLRQGFSEQQMKKKLLQQGLNNGQVNKSFHDVKLRKVKRQSFFAILVVFAIVTLVFAIVYINV